MEKYITCSVLINNEIKRIGKKRENKLNRKWYPYILQVIDSVRFMASLLSNLADNLTQGIHKIKCKYRHDNKKCENSRIKYKDCEGHLELIMIL